LVTRSSADQTTARSHLGGPPYPDSVVVLTEGDRSAIFCLEIDRATQRLAAIEGKLASYRCLLDDFPDWHLLFVAPTTNRARWLREVADEADETVAARAWVTSLTSLRRRHLGAELQGIATSARRSTLADLLAPTSLRRSRTPVGSEAWLHLLGEGGIEELDEVLW
jgi:hypothetical protein